MKQITFKKSHVLRSNGVVKVPDSEMTLLGWHAGMEIAHVVDTEDNTLTICRASDVRRLFPRAIGNQS